MREFPRTNEVYQNSSDYTGRWTYTWVYRGHRIEVDDRCNYSIETLGGRSLVLDYWSDRERPEEEEELLESWVDAALAGNDYASLYIGFTPRLRGYMRWRYGQKEPRS